MVYVKEFLQAFEVLFWQIIGIKKNTQKLVLMMYLSLPNSIYCSTYGFLKCDNVLLLHWVQL